ncbi:hypothetical protein CK203_097698 [Vitis vinifera]|uniref:RING-type domain-containing protein n=1 Tax=Vitis vinifera TaxID=29760 RepID=A0A438EHA9_VITVI|nr:hypothetical protein CK203_097698 [Vitis vinifera]
MLGGSTFAKTICTICYEDLKPIVEDLQSISVCGHVFHELCLQQWFEYCANKKKNSCPVCKQTCSLNGVNRLYFQSIGDASDPTVSQKPLNIEEDPGALRREVKRLEVKVAGLTSVLERNQKDLKELNEELCLCKEQFKEEAALKNETLKQKAFIQQLLYSKSQDLDKSNLECSRLQERNMALAKELAALKLVSDLSLDEEGVLKLASFCQISPSCILFNRSYKELMAKCNLLGRGEARSVRKLEKAKGKIQKLKTRVQELETAIEVKDNEVLRALIASKKRIDEEANLNSIKCNFSSSPINDFSPEDCMDQPAVPISKSDQIGNLNNGPLSSKTAGNLNSIKDTSVNYSKSNVNVVALDQDIDSYLLIDEDVLEISAAMHELPDPYLKPKSTKAVAVQNSSILVPEAASAISRKPLAQGPDDIEQLQPLPQIRKEAPFPIRFAKPGDKCFAPGLIGPDGTPRYLGKWCKRDKANGSNPSSVGMQGSSTSTGDLIAVGADGRGGRIKVLRSHNQPSVDRKETSAWAKRCKLGTKTNGLQSQGCLQIEHFFSKTGR